VSNTEGSQIKPKEDHTSQSKYDDDDILWRILWAEKFTILIISFVFAVGSIFFALSKPDIYRASTILSPVSSESGAGGLAALAGQFGGLASMAGINLSGAGNDKTTLALEIIRTRSFIETFIEKHNLLVPIMAADKWDMESNTLVLDNELYDSKNQKWVRVVSSPKKTTPSSWEAYQKFLELLSVSQDDKTSMVVVAIEFYSPTLAQQWLSWLIIDINEYIRTQDQQEAQASIDYLYKQLAKIEVSNTEAIFYQLIEEQTKNMMLAHVKTEYVFKTIDPPQFSDEKAKPKRAIIVVVGTLLGGFLSVLLVLIRYFIR